MKCKKCGEELPDRARFCPECGAPVEEVPAPKKLEGPIEPAGVGAVPIVPAGPPPRATRVTPRVPRPYGAARSARSGGRIPLSSYPTLAGEEGGVPPRETSRAPRPPEPPADAEVAPEGAGRREDAGSEPTRELPADPRPEPDPVPAGGGAPSPHTVAARVRSVLSRGRDQRVLVGVGAFAAVVAIGFLVYVSLGWFGPFADRSYVAPEVQPPSDGSIEPLEGQDEGDAPAIEGGPEVRAALGDYSWQELSQISALIAGAETDDEGTQIAAHYNLCDEDGSIDPENTKDLELTDGTTVPIAVAGLRHDERSDGSGTAGISFVARGSIGSEPMNALAQTTGGWEASTLRVYLNEGLLAKMPSDLADLLVYVEKVTNPVLGSGSTEQVVTSDMVWVPSYSEIVGELDAGSWFYGAYQSEGEQYRIFSDLGVTWGEGFSQIALPSGEYWWERSPSPTNASWFLCVSPDGETSYGHLPATADAVVIGFCL